MNSFFDSLGKNKENFSPRQQRRYDERREEFSCKWEKPAMTLLVSIAVIAAALRFYRITEPQFFFYDEGLYLTNNIDFLQFIDHHPIDSLWTLKRFFQVLTHLSLAEAKSLWFFLANLRGLFFGLHGEFWTRFISAFFGTLTLIPTFLLAKRFYNSKWTAWLSLVLLAVLPSHFFYSRLGLQEGFSTFCFITGIYFYLSSEKLSLRTFFSGLFFACVFLTNYRMIILPGLIGFIELFLSFSEKRCFDLRKYTWNTLTFLLIIFLIGNIEKGANTNITFAWMFYQAHLAHEDHFDWLNYFSYPYYLFRLESALFAIFFFGNLYYFFQKEWRRMLFFSVVLLQMIIFSSAQEKGVRYICTGLPLMAIAVSSLIVYLFERNPKAWLRWILVSSVCILLANHLYRICEILNFREDYQTSIADLKKINLSPKVASTQPLIQKLYVANPNDVTPMPQQAQSIITLYMRGYRYLIIDPQAYISYTEDGKRFNPRLKGYLTFFMRFVKPSQIYPHYNQALMERFVFEHNIHLQDSLAFLRLNRDGHLGQLYVYRIEDCLKQMIEIKKIKR